MLATIRDRYLLALQYEDFRRLWTVNAFAGAAQWALIIARGWLAYEITGAALWVGLVTFAAMIPRLFSSPIVGFMSDRFDRVTILRVGLTLNMLHNVALALMVMLDADSQSGPQRAPAQWYRTEPGHSAGFSNGGCSRYITFLGHTG